MNTALLKRSDQAMFCEVGTDIVALNIQRGQCYGMEDVTAAVWALLAEPTDIERICDELVEIYDVEPDVCRADLEELMEQFRTEGLVEYVHAAP